jgi:hypothetical protein
LRITTIQLTVVVLFDGGISIRLSYGSNLVGFRMDMIERIGVDVSSLWCQATSARQAIGSDWRVVGARIPNQFALPNV